LEGELYNQRKDGSIFPIDLSTSVIRDEKGKIIALVGVSRDITERKQAEEEIKSLAKFPSENPNPILRFDLNGVLLYANDAALKFFSDWKLKEGKAIPVVLQELTHDIEKQRSRTKDISYREQIFSVSITFHQEFGYIDVYAIDTTERKQAEETLLALKSYTENIITSITDALFVVASDTTIQTVNTSATALLGYTEDELIGKPIRMVFEEGGEEEVFTEQALSNVEGKLQVIYDRDPEDFWSMFKLALVGAVIVSSDGKIVMVNREIESIFGYDQGELIGKMIHELLPAKLRDVHEKRRVEFMDRPHPRVMGKGRLLKAKRKDGTMFDLEVGLFPLQMDGEMHVLSVIRDFESKERWEFIRFTRFGRLFTEDEVFWNVDRILVTKNGEKIPVLMSGSLMQNDSDENYKTVLIVKDITERKQAEEELVKHREHLEELVKERTKELEKKNAELKRFNKLFVGREFRIKELKEKIKELESSMKKNREK
jgi:PAS domain S-box-containing protein